MTDGEGQFQVEVDSLGEELAVKTLAGAAMEVQAPVRRAAGGTRRTFAPPDAEFRTSSQPAAAAFRLEGLAGGEYTIVAMAAGQLVFITEPIEVDATGRPQRGVGIALLHGTGVELLSGLREFREFGRFIARTDIDGRLRLDGLGPETYEVQACRGVQVAAGASVKARGGEVAALRLELAR